MRVGIEARRAPHDELRSRELHRDAAEHALRAIVLARIDENSEQHEKTAHRKEIRRAEQPVIRAAKQSPRRGAAPRFAGRPGRRGNRHRLSAFAVHTITSSAPGSTSSDSTSSVSTSPSTTTSTGSFRSNSIRVAVRRDASLCFMCEPSNNFGRFRTRPRRPIGPQCTYSIAPLSMAACGAIIILPPVYLLLLKATNRQRRSSRSPSARKGNGRRRSRASETSTPTR